MIRRQFTAVVGAAFILATLPGASHAFTNISQVSGGPMALQILSANPQPSANRLFEVTFRGTNTGATQLLGVSFLYCYNWDTSTSTPYSAFAYNNGTQQFDLGNRWIRPYTVPAENFLMSDTDIPLSFNNGDGATYATATLLGSDMVPSKFLGDFAPGQSKDFIFYVETSAGTWPFESTGFFVAVPEPGSLLTLASACAGLLAFARRRRI